ncbi:thiamine phosphate synthase [Salisediminibacterium halotolerans]|uniref:thiamine phosphate synthase n=1 Tax=Salisediminibacterium halotolerans TaxID=517425 RepID=UPI000EAB5993|nr:thiamine phosphate synthase [Salisediminibacterium halotolerans]RLJ71806.1 thiamine-phosphate diphosphorylase [Actinophytocola xinjiangensis]RPE86956.1 thiamine-phosphate diphosphorylase [Salisediminibacterium halotolerans]TWG33019.1 thiamine-phosphate diphosphorylase [Salisediminibacterium halotolerans]GEL08916.1 thiamine-phosphate synthase [Salisediminibacterium halotolerans]
MIAKNNVKDALSLYFISGTQDTDRDLHTVLEDALAGGITAFQYREKGAGSLTGKEKEQMARTLQKQCRQQNIPFIVNDDVELALAIGADGVHVGQEDSRAEDVRLQIGPDMLLGVSAHTISEAEHALQSGADYIGVGPMYPTSTKSDAKDVCGPEMIASMRNANIDLPIVGIGGISAENAQEVIAGGADGISLISEISTADDPREKAAVLFHQILTAKQKRSDS